ncbi:MAG: flavodoxin-dependent (E)-4-hydroxy-3-methylbut-2-enyl-diphosphate synthase [Thermodesulfobacteriota bacterium]|nr:MAG: flavodoxin-dependent (E)-4-hydroxy-3-methylbut-2-enyl-diphosphate synthase [Thermodesulfobacteriota bacterium]
MFTGKTDMRRKTKRIMVGGVAVGGGAPVSVQSMTNTNTADVEATVSQIRALEKAGCEIIRVAVPDAEAASSLGAIKGRIKIPLIADIHFDWRLALKAVDEGVDALRLNPGNIGSKGRIKEVVAAAKGGGLPIRIGVNAGSLEKDILEKYGRPTEEALVESALRHVRILEALGFDAIKISLKASSVPLTIKSYKLLAEKVDYPLHIGITEAGTLFAGTIKSAVGLGSLLAEGLGDTLRVSITGDPVDEVRVGWEILKALELRKRGVNIISCPTCGRIKFDCAGIASALEERLSHIEEPVSVAVMGCVVNGPGEAVEADVGVAGGDGVGLIYISGRSVRKVREEEILDVITEEVVRIVEERKGAP